MSEIWTPPSHRFGGLAEARQAVKDYDPDLDFGVNQETGQWCVFLTVGSSELTREKPLPVLGFDHIPGRDEVQKRLYHSDAVRRGREILDNWNRHNDSIREQAAEISDADREMAEKFAWGFKKVGSEKAPTQVYMPGEGNGL